jgi:predicted solute-binding protein
MDQVIDDLKDHQIISPGHVAMAFRAFLVSKLWSGEIHYGSISTYSLLRNAANAPLQRS